MYTDVQRPGCKKENTATYVYIRAGSRTPTRAYLHGWVEMEKQSRHCVHGEATECVVFIGRQRNAWEPTGLDGTGDGNEAWRIAEGGNGLVFDRPFSKRDPVHREGSGVPQNGGHGPPTVETGVLLIGRGVAYRKMEETDLLWSKRGSY